MAGFERILIICPPHLVPKWKREVEMTVPGVRAAIVAGDGVGGPGRLTGRVDSRTVVLYHL